MTKSASLALLFSLLFTQSLIVAQQPPKLEDPPWIKLVATPRIFYTVPGMDKIQPRKDVTYKSVSKEELRMDVYQPRSRRRGALSPAIVFVHGGSIPSNLRTKPKEWGAYVSLGQLAAASGFVGITFNHRFYGWDMNSLSDARSDVSAAIAYVRNNSARLGVDKDRICLWSLSAGSVLLGSAISEPPPHIRCLVFYYPIMDLEPMRKPRPAITDDVTKEFSPINRLRRARFTFPPIFIARAGREESALNAAVDTFIQVAVERKATLDFSNHPNGQHGFDVLDDNARTREIIKRTIEFIRTRND